MHYRKTLYPLLLIILCCFSSCFQIIEEINLSNNGSGTVTLTVNLSASKTKVASIMLLDSINGYKVPSRQTLQKEMNEVVAQLRTSPGISNVQQKMDFENYIATVSFAFRDISNINNLNQRVLKRLKVNAGSTSSYTYGSNAFQRNYSHTKEAVIQYNKLKPEVKNVFKDATYVSIYRFDKPVTSMTNPLARLSKTKKAVMLNTGIPGLINGKTNISNKIILAK